MEEEATRRPLGVAGVGVGVGGGGGEGAGVGKFGSV